MSNYKYLLLAVLFATVLGSCSRCGSRVPQKPDQTAGFSNSGAAAPAAGGPSPAPSAPMPAASSEPMSAVSGRPVSVASARPAAEASVQPAHTEPVSAGAAASAKGQAVTPTLDHEIAPAPKKPVARAKSPVCFTISYSDSHRKPGTAAGDDETWLRQRVQVALNHDFAHVAAQSICVKVGGVAVKFKVVLPKGKTKPSGPVQLSLAPVRPNAKLAVSYCVAKNFCHEECKIPKDEFMDAFSAAAGGLGEGGSGGWNDEKKPPSKDEKELHDEVSGLEKDLLGGGANEEVYRGWTKGAVTPFCEM